MNGFTRFYRYSKTMLGHAGTVGLLGIVGVSFVPASTPLPIGPSYSHAAKAYAAVHTLSFFKNSEYFTPFAEGQTLAGFQLQPLVGYQPVPYFLAQVGVFARRYWAEPRFFSQSVPTLTIAYQQANNHLIMGSLPTGVTHRLIRPLYNPTETLRGVPPTGLAFSWIRERTLAHVWLEWRTLLDKTTNKPEELVAGCSAEQGLAYFDPISFHLPFQIVVYHLGGQGIMIKDFSLWMGTLGLRITWHLTATALLKKITWENYYIINSYVKQVSRPFRQGMGWLSQLGLYTNRHFQLQIAYWYGRGFSSENVGAPLYQSVRIVDGEVDHAVKERSLLLVHLNYKALIGPSLAIGIHVDPYYDFRHNLVEQEAGLYIIYNPYFRLA